ncbi:hypothetical protein V5O48_005271 [Marasmius crinis-equi]|uniref:Uncharacterized protein n=1 Tax=Marasmius crinis-equi TaxID=585013 RepID=A0ABR3FMQ4_9AGAR
MIPLSFWNILAAFLAFLAFLCTRLFDFDISIGLHTPPLPVSYLAGPAASSLERLSLHHAPSPNASTADVTAVILNWSRLPNVIRIVSILCSPLLDGVLATILIWNNNPSIILKEEVLGCRHKVQVKNSPYNAYFGARFEACATAPTPFCFIQDDDYLILPEIVYALRARATHTSPSGIFLQPPDEMLASAMSRISVDSRIHTSFSWLGYGSIIRRSEARDLLDVMRVLNLTDEEVKMADNYFSVLRNTFTENWFDQNIPLGGGQAFTVGQEGTERNNRHIRRAAELLDSILLCEGPSCILPELNSIPFIQSGPPLELSSTVAPCVGAACILETSIGSLANALGSRAQAARSILDVQNQSIRSLQPSDRDTYLKHPPSQAVDGKPETAFCHDGVKSGEHITLELLHDVPPQWSLLELAMLVDPGTGAMIRGASFYLLGEGDPAIGGSPECHEVEGYTLEECHVTTSHLSQGSLSLRLSFEQESMKPWCFHEMWIRGT